MRWFSTREGRRRRVGLPATEHFVQIVRRRVNGARVMSAECIDCRWSTSPDPDSAEMSFGELRILAFEHSYQVGPDVVDLDDIEETMPSTEDPDPRWIASHPYAAGTTVTHNGARWRARWLSQGEEPGTPVASSAWQQLT